MKDEAGFAGVIAGAGLVIVRRDLLERVTLLSGMVAMGSSTLYGVGFRSGPLSATRLIFHFFAYVLGAIVFTRMLARSGSNPP